MPYFIKTGFWASAARGLKGWLNLDDIVKSIVTWFSVQESIPDQSQNSVLIGPVSGDGPVTFRTLTTADLPVINTDTISFVSVKDFGALGDGTGNDQPFIQAAIDYAITNEIKQVFFPVGNYRITTPI